MKFNCSNLLIYKNFLFEINYTISKYALFKSLLLILNNKEEKIILKIGSMHVYKILWLLLEIKRKVHIYLSNKVKYLK